MPELATEKRLRVSFDAEEESLRRAVHIKAAMSGKTHNDVLNELIREHLAAEVEMAKQAIADENRRTRG